ELKHGDAASTLEHCGDSSTGLTGSSLSFFFYPISPLHFSLCSLVFQLKLLVQVVGHGGGVHQVIAWSKMEHGRG
ncbi:hypothetical protein NK662_23325, partial [Ectobacillus sp. SYSU M60031]|nr:hypothetical protein [Ectobacillus ponti]